jgi:hypothetical protein
MEQKLHCFKNFDKQTRDKKFNIHKCSYNLAGKNQLGLPHRRDRVRPMPTLSRADVRFASQRRCRCKRCRR